MEYREHPFGKSISQLEAKDLAILREVYEGWTVEYKEQLSSAKIIAKSISSFANHHGGWIFYGVEESRPLPVAQSFPGLETADVRSAIQSIENSAQAHIFPTSPHFECRVLEGPCGEIGLGPGRSVVVVRIPMGADPPYIHSDGRIYRRVNECSDPKAETDRTRLESLWEQGRRNRLRVRRLLQARPQLSRDELNSLGVLNLFVTSDPYGDLGHSSNLAIADFTEIVTHPHKTEGGLRFDTVFAIADDYFARMTGGNDPDRIVVTLRYRQDCSSVFTIPLNKFESPSNRAAMMRFCNGKKCANAFLHLLADRGHSDAALLDLTPLPAVLFSAMVLHRRLAHADSIDGPFHVKATVDGVWRVTPYLDTPGYIEAVRSSGIPVVQDRSLETPRSDGPAPLLDTGTTRLDEDGQVIPGQQLASDVEIVVPILTALGVPISLMRDSQLVLEWVSATARACGGPPRSPQASTRPT